MRRNQNEKSHRLLLGFIKRTTQLPLRGSGISHQPLQSHKRVRTYCILKGCPSENSLRQQMILLDETMLTSAKSENLRKFWWSQHDLVKCCFQSEYWNKYILPHLAHWPTYLILSTFFQLLCLFDYSSIHQTLPFTFNVSTKIKTLVLNIDFINNWNRP